MTIRVRPTKYARIGEFVKLTSPMRFDRCGYPLTTFDIERDPELTDRIEDMIDRAARAMFPSAPITHLGGISLGPIIIPSSSSVSIDHRITKHLKQAAVIAILIERDFGGNERGVYEHDISADSFDEARTYIGANWLVTGKKFVKTGTRYSGHSGYDHYSGEQDYEPPGLADEKTHCVYTLQTNGGVVLRTLAKNVTRRS